MRRILAVVSVFTVAGLTMTAAVADTPPAPPAQPPPAAGGQIAQGQFVPAKGSSLRIRGTAKLIRGVRGSTKLSVHASGLPSDKAYPTWLHSGACADNSP